MPAGIEDPVSLRELAEVIHDLGSPLQSIYNRLVLIKRANGLPPAARGHVEAALEQMEQAVYLVRKTRAAALVRHAACLEMLDLAALLRQVRQGLGYLHDQHPSVIWIEEYPAGPARVMGCPQELARLFNNLVTNSFEAMGSQSGVLKVTVQTAGDGRVEARVADTGGGLPAPSLALGSLRLETTKPHGLGLGLAICQKIVREHGGCLDVFSQPPFGTVISVRLPGCNGGESAL